MDKAVYYADFYKVIDSEFDSYEKSGCDKEVYADLKNNIAKSMLITFKNVYGEDSEFYLHSSMVYMKTVNDCVRSYLKLSPQNRTGKFHSYFFSILKKNINESCRLERESSGLGISFGAEIEKASAARQKFFKIKKHYNDLINYDDSLSEDEIIKKIAIIEGMNTDEVKVFIPFVTASSVSITSKNADGKEYSPVDASMQRKIANGDGSKLEVPEELVISRGNMETILDSIEDVYKNDNREDDKKFLSLVITFKILSLFEPNATSKNIRECWDVVSFLPETYNLENLLLGYDFIDEKLVNDFFNGSFPKQNDLEKKLGMAQGTIVNKWKRFNKKLLDKYASQLGEIRYD